MGELCTSWGNREGKTREGEFPEKKSFADLLG